MMGAGVEGVDVVKYDPSRRRGRKIVLITCQSYVAIAEEERKERKRVARVTSGIYV